MVYALNLASNLADLLSKQWQFYIIGVPYLGYALFFLHTYRSTREMCFYCKYAMIQNPVFLILMATLYMDSFPRYYFISAFGLTFLSLLARGFARRERLKQLKK